MKKFLSVILAILMVVTSVPLALAADTVTLYLKNDAGWQSTMYAYCWKENDSVRPLGSWPGTLMDELEGESQLYAIDVPADTYAIIFNDGGINQTPDLFLPTDGSNYYNNATGEWTTISTRGHDHALTADGEVLEFTTLPADTTRIDTAGNYYLTQDMELTDNLWIDVEGTVNLCLNGHSITAVEDDSNQTVVFLYGGTLNLCDCKGGGCITSTEGLTSNGVRTFGDTEFNMYSGEIKNNYYYAVNCVDFNMYGGKLSGNKWGAVYASGTFNMYGGEISGNSGNWGTVRVDNNGSFTMYDGEIKNNININTTWNSGTVYAEDGTFTMKGGKITGNTGGSGSGGVYAGVKFVMEGGEISGNSGNTGGVLVNTGGSFIMNGGVIKNNTASADGGGVWLNQNASFTMNGGEISGNTAKDGGGVYSSFDSAKINLKKGLITNNTATESVGGVGSYYGNTPVIISGADVQIMNNTAPTYPDLKVNAPVTVSAPLDSAKTKISLSVNGEIIAKPDGTNLTTLEGMENCFVLSNEERFVMCNENGELVAIKWSATIAEKDGDLVVTATDNGEVTYQWYEVNGDELTELEGETSSTLAGEKLVVDKTYACRIYLNGEEMETLAIKYPYAITHQPTAGEPYVELNDDTDATYQWYTVENDRTEVVDDGEIGACYYDSYYDEETGWNGEWWGDDGADYLYVYLEEGQTVTIVPSAYCAELGIWSYNYDYYDYDECNAGEEFKYTAETEDWYYVYAYTDYADETTLRVYIDNMTYTKIEGETSAELKNPELGEKYACEVTYGNGETEVSDAFEYTYAITHQPTEAEPYVELNDDTDASYQWYTVEGDGAEITDENASGDWQSLGAPFDNTVYEDGKWIADNSMGIQYYFIVELEAGDTVNFEFASEVEFIVFAINGDTDEVIEVGGTECSVTVEESGAYWLITTPVDYVCADIGSIAYNAIEGENAAVLNPTALGRYACEVTFADGTSAMSKVFEVTTLHTCDFTGEWKYDSEKHWKECTADSCSKISEEADHSFVYGKCYFCDYECPHESYTDGVCDNCEYYCPHENVTGATCRTPVECDVCGYSVFDWTNHEGEYVTVWFNDYQHVSEYECCHIESSVVYEDHKYENYTITTPADCVNNAWETGECICGDTHTREIAGSAKNHDWSNLDGVCANGCGAECPHEKYTNGICDNCGYECAHEWGEGVLTRPVYDAVLGSKDGYYTYTCTLCGEEKTETVKSADYSAYETVSEEINALLQSDELTDAAKQAIYSAANECGLPSNDLTESEQNIVDDLVAELEKIVADAEEKIANGEYVKIDGLEEIVKINDKLNEELAEKYGEEALAEITDKIGYKYDEEFDELYEKAEALTGSVAENAEALKEIEEAMKAIFAEIEKCLAGTHSFTDYYIVRYADCVNNAWEEGTCSVCGETDEREIPDSAYGHTPAWWWEKTETEHYKHCINDCCDDEIEGTRGQHVYENYEITKAAACGANAEETGTCICGMTHTREIEGTALKHSFTKYEETEAPKCGVAGKEVAYCDHGCGATDEREIEGSALEHSFTKYEVTEEAKCGVAGKEVAYCDHGCGATDEKEIAALEHSFTKYEVTEEAKCGKAGKEVAYCDHGCGATDEREIPALEHSFLDYVSNGDATCTADGTKTAECANGCGETDTVADEGSKLDHADEDGDKICDDCEAEIVDTCPDCGRKAHDDSLVQNLICLIIMLLNLIKTMY